MNDILCRQLAIDYCCSPEEGWESVRYWFRFLRMIFFKVDIFHTMEHPWGTLLHKRLRLEPALFLHGLSL